MNPDYDPRLLVRAACEAAQRAYAPYSQIRVGAALWTTSGLIYTACNVENASYGLTICAERAAVFKAVSEGQISFEVLAVSVPGGGMPCGSCRQVLQEFNPDLRVLSADQDGNPGAEYRLSELLPHPFSPKCVPHAK